MWPVVIGCVLGAVLVGRTKPTSVVKKRELIGPATGNIYPCDDFSQTGILVVHGPQCVCAFLRTPQGLAFVKALGNPQGIRIVCSDVIPALLKEHDGT